ncbi:MAG: sugar ABC transporter permease [Lachnospiraceae bacterium]|nr:sugar ABC transporter permease [Lachnospiraceae bacterium]
MHKKTNRVVLSPSKRRSLFLSRLIIWVTIVIVMFPALWIIMASLSKGDSFFSTSLFPDEFSLVNYTRLFAETNFGLWVFNSLKMCFLVAIIQLLLTTTAAYAFARIRFPGRSKGLMTVLVLQVFPSSMALAGYYVIIYKFGLVNNLIAIVFVLAAGSAYNVWLLKTYMDGIPKELDESAFVDGAGHLTTFLKIILPLAAPQIAVIFIFSFIATYSEYVISSVFLQTPDSYTLAIGLQSFIADQFNAHWTMFAAAAVLASVPVMVIFMLLQKFIQGGLVSGGVKG